jgi:hypothetical protein
VLPYAVCKHMSADMFLISVAVWSTLQLLLAIIYSMSVVSEPLIRRLRNLVDTDVVIRIDSMFVASKALMRRLRNLVDTDVVPRT